MHFEFPDGATPLPDYSDLLLPWVQNMGDLNRVEAENISHAQRKYLQGSVRDISSWFHYQGLKNIHFSMFGKVWAWAGKQRKNITSIGVAPNLISLQIGIFCEEVASWSGEPIELTFLEKSARIHHRLAYIHLFENGNGRFSRLVADRYLKVWKCQFPIWPKEIHSNGMLRKQYISSLKLADVGDYTELIRFMKKYGAKEPALSEILGHSFYKKKLKEKYLIALIRAYLNQGYCVNETINNGHHPLQLAIKQGLEKVAKLLINSEAKLDFRDKSGYNAFEMAIIKNQLNIAKMLYDYGYPYQPRQPVLGKLLQYYKHLHDFDRRFF